MDRSAHIPDDRQAATIGREDRAPGEVARELDGGTSPEKLGFLCRAFLGCCDVPARQFAIVPAYQDGIPLIRETSANGTDGFTWGWKFPSELAGRHVPEMDGFLVRARITRARDQPLLAARERQCAHP